MNKIKLLPPDQAQKIAAGEVVERPANIIKELLENSLDAGAKQISLYIEEAGKKLIRIIDDGCGMSPEDASLCFLPHATSKITSIDQLETLTSYGFRGEALASISAVSKVTLLTKQAAQKSGILLQYSESKVLQQKEASCPQGTDLSVADLFYNVPVRKKFLKQDETEWNQIQSLFQAFCISNPTIAFKLFHDNKLILNAPPVTNLKDRITQVWDFNFAQQLLPLKSSAHIPEWLSVSGYISNHHFWRYGKQTIFFFVNERWVKNPELSKALLKGYLNVLPPGKYPAAFIMLTLKKDLVDINCHPKKEEVRFTKPGAVATAITTLVKQTLEQSVSHKLEQKSSLPVYEKQAYQIPLESKHLQKPEYTHQLFDLFPPQPRTYQEQNTHEPIIHVRPQENIEPISIPQTEIFTANIVGQLFNTYILIDNDDEFIMIDQHAAHERILYEKFLKNFAHKEGTKLLFPEIIQLTKENLVTLVKEKEFFAQQGFELEQVSPTEVALKTAPPQLNDTPLKAFIYDILAFIEENEQADYELFRKKLNEHTHSHMACKAAIKAGDKLTHEQMVQLVKDLYKTEKRFICVHGRPTIWSISKHEIEKHFRR